MSTTAPVETQRPDTEDAVKTDHPWIVIVWNDPINLMSYVVYVFQKLFNYPRPKATTLMLEVHNEGKSAVASGSRERCEFWVAALHRFGLWATLYHDA
jgi:ATP-dependent Clp protease adaptor protein ClpS